MRRLTLLAVACAALGTGLGTAQAACRIEDYGADLGNRHVGICAGVKCYEGYCDVEADPYCWDETRAFDACDLVDGV